MSISRFAYFFLIGISAFTIVGCGSSNEPNEVTCGEFKTGTFKYVGSEDIRIERTETEQIEYNLNGEGGYVFTDKYHIVWTNDCEYYLTLDSTDHAHDLNFSKNDTMWTKINSVNRNGYSFIAVKGSKTFEGKLKKVDI